MYTSKVKKQIVSAFSPFPLLALCVCVFYCSIGEQSMLQQISAIKDQNTAILRKYELVRLI